MTTEDMHRGQEVLGHLMTVNTGMGRAIQRMNDYESLHGHLPVEELRTLAGLLAEITVEIADYADCLDRPVIDKGSAVVAAGTRKQPLRILGEITMGDDEKHSGERDKQTDHLDKGSDGHTTESGSDK